MAGLLREKREDVEKDLSIFFPSIDDLDIYPDIRNNNSVKEMFEAFQDSGFIELILAWEKQHPFKSQKFLAIIYSGFVNPPMFAAGLSEEFRGRQVIFRRDRQVKQLDEIIKLFLFISYLQSELESLNKASSFSDCLCSFPSQSLSQKLVLKLKLFTVYSEQHFALTTKEPTCSCTGTYFSLTKTSFT